MSERERAYFELTIKGCEELSVRTYRLGPRVRNILFLIQKGTPTVEAILENSIFPREEVIENLRQLLKNQFVSLHRASNPSTSLSTLTGSLGATTIGPPAAPTATAGSREAARPDAPAHLGL
jgi:hypothetical protein